MVALIHKNDMRKELFFLWSTPHFIFWEKCRKRIESQKRSL